jgi:hypothetical protein
MTVTPIKPDIEPKLDVERELVEFCMGAIKSHIEKYGEPAAIALALIGPDAPDTTSTTSLWSPRSVTVGSRIASFASTLFLARALKPN